MQISTPHPTHSVFTKTAKGHDEVARRGFGLNPRQRRVLIVMDGTKSLSTITEMIPRQELDEIVSFLAQQSFIALAEGRDEKRQSSTIDGPPNREPDNKEIAVPVVPEPVLAAAPQQAFSLSPKPEMTFTQDAEKIREIKDFMTTTATTYLGLMAADLIHRIERAKEAAALRSVIAQWHMALCESKHGNRFAAPYLQQVTAALAGKVS